MDGKSSKAADEVIIDVENNLRVEKSISNKHITRTWSGFAKVGCKGVEITSLGGNLMSITTNGESVEEGRKFGSEEENVGLSEREVVIDKPKRKVFKKPPKPPRPPKAFSLGASDEKVVREMAELAMLKRARIERMKALKKMKNAKTSSSGSNSWALFVTILFCFIIFWQAM